MRNRYFLLVDLPLVAAAALGAFVLRFEWNFASIRPEWFPFLLAALLIKPIMFLGFGLYQRYWRYASVVDLVLVTAAVTAASLAMGVFVAVAVASGGIVQFSRMVLVNDWLLTFVFVGWLRFSARLLAEAAQRSRAPKRESRRVLIAGAGESGMLVVREMRRNPHLGLVPVAFIDDDPNKRRKRIAGLPVAGSLDEIGIAIDRYRAQEVFIAMPKAPGSVVRRVAEAARERALTPRVLPGVYELLDGKVNVSRLREVDITDLLRRQPISGRRATTYLAGQVVLVTGAGGSIGSELCRQVAAAGPVQLILLGHGENSIFDVYGELVAAYPALDIQPVIADVRNRQRLDEVFAQYRPRVVLHAAAHKHVPLMEQNPGEAISNNVLGTQNVVEASVRHAVERFVMISTDKAVAPASVMGASKRVAEMLVRSAALRAKRSFVIVRFGNVLGSRGSIVGTFKRQIASGGPLTITHPDMQRFFMTIPEAVHLVLEAGGCGGCGELFVLNMGRLLRITDLAQDLIRLSGASPDDIPIVYTGMRPGEKLVETLYEPQAVVTATENPDIMRVNEGPDPDPAVVQSVITELTKVASIGGEEHVRGLLRDIVPTFSAPLSPPRSTDVFG